MDFRKLGRTNEQVSIACLGGWHIGPIPIPEENDSIRLMHSAIERGINFFDNSWDYHEGVSEERMGKALATGGLRQKIFLMTKVCNRDGTGAQQCLEDSLRRLRTDYIDLWQFHEINFDNDRSGSSHAAGSRWPSGRGTKVRCALSGSPDIKIHGSTWTCCPGRLNGTPARCPST